MAVFGREPVPQAIEGFCVEEGASLSSHGGPDLPNTFAAIKFVPETPLVIRNISFIWFARAMTDKIGWQQRIVAEMSQQAVSQSRFREA